VKPRFTPVTARLKPSLFKAAFERSYRQNFCARLEAVPAKPAAADNQLKF
jgi:hypothetical protein